MPRFGFICRSETPVALDRLRWNHSGERGKRRRGSRMVTVKGPQRMSIPRTEGFLDVGDGERLWFETAGEGPDLILSHGLGGNAAVWYQQVPFFARDHRVITWDQRGFGRSTNVTGSHGPVNAVSDLVALMDHLGVAETTLIGQSMGGWASLGAALAVPDRVRSLVLACTTGGIPVQSGAPALPPAAPNAGDAATLRRAVLPLGQHPAIGERLLRLDPARAYLYQALGTFGNRPTDAELMRLLAETTFDDAAIRALDLPVLFIAGELDGLMTPALLRTAATWLTRSTIVELPGLGHSPYFEDPDTWNAVVDDFLSQHH